MSDWNDGIIKEFRENGGRTKMFGDGLLLLHTIGAKSGAEHLVPTAGIPVDGVTVLVASKGGAPDNPSWYYNLRANPEIEVERHGADGVETVRVRATEVTGADRDELFAKVAAIAPGFGDYQTKTTRVIPLFTLAPAD